MKHSNNSLVMCTTPLQMLIAEKIIELNPNETFDLIVIALSDNLKYKHYYSRLKKKCNKSLYYVSSPGLVGFIKYIMLLKKKGLDKEYNKLYLASIDSRHLQYLVSKNQNCDIYTFDDGTANIIKGGLYFNNLEPPLYKKIIWRSLGIKHYMKNIKSLSKLHFTIYKNVSNIVHPTYLIRLYSENTTNHSSSQKERRIANFYLGQPLHEISSHYTHSFIAKIINKFNIDFYYPHPRETTLPDTQAETISSNLIFEDYILKYLKDNPNTKVNVYSFISSCNLNISQLDRVESIYIYDSYLDSKYRDFYKFAINELNIKTIKV